VLHLWHAVPFGKLTLALADGFLTERAGGLICLLARLFAVSLQVFLGGDETRLGRLGLLDGGVELVRRPPRWVDKDEVSDGDQHEQREDDARRLHARLLEERNHLLFLLLFRETFQQPRRFPILLVDVRFALTPSPVAAAS